MQKVYIYKDVEYQSEYLLRKAIFKEERLALPKISTAEDWAKISIDSYYNSSLTKATRYYYSETRPTNTTYQYWHYVNGVPTKW